MLLPSTGWSAEVDGDRGKKKKKGGREGEREKLQSETWLENFHNSDP